MKKVDRISLGEDKEEISKLKMIVEKYRDFIIWLCEEELGEEVEIMQEKFNEWEAENEREL